MRKPLFSLSLIARNEAKTLPVTLAPSLKQFFEAGGDAVLIDTGSKDGTPDIARKLGFRVFEMGDKFRLPIGEMADAINHQFVVEGEEPIVKTGDTVFDFAAARNYSAAQCQNDFIMIADCDEYFTNLNLEALNKRIESGMQRMDIQFVHDHLEDGSPRITFRRGVFFDRRACEWGGVVHETIYDKKEGVVSEWIPQEEVLLEHRQIDSGNRSSYIAGLAWECFTKPDKDRQSHYFGRELMYGGRYKSAIREFSRHIAMPNAWRVEQGQSMIYVGDCRGYLKDPTSAVGCWQTAFTMAPMRREALMRLAWNYYRNGENQPAAAYAAAALTIPWPNCYCDQKQHYTHEPHEILYVTLWYLGDREGSKYHWKKAIGYCPNNPKYISDGQFYK